MDLWVAKFLEVMSTTLYMYQKLKISPWMSN